MPRQRNDFDVDGRIVRAQNLDVKLMVLAIATRLGTFVAKDLTDPPDLPGRRGSVLDKRAHDRRGRFGAQRVLTLAAIFEHVHFLLGHLAVLTNAAIKDADLFEDRRDEQRESVAVGKVGEGGDEAFPLGRRRAQHIVRPDGRAERGDRFAHEDLCCPGSWRKASKTPSTPLRAVSKLLKCAGSASSTSKINRTIRDPEVMELDEMMLR